MDYRRFQFWEKLEIQLAVAAGAAVMYFAVWPLVRPTDPDGPAAFLPAGQYAPLAGLALAGCVLALVGGLVTPTARLRGGLVVAMIGAGGLSLHSPPIRGLLWDRQNDLPATYWLLAGELIILACVMAVAALLVRLARAIPRKVCPWCVSPDLLGQLSDEERTACLRSAGPGAGKGGATHGVFGGGFRQIVLEDQALREAREAGRPLGGKEVLTRCALGTLLGLVATVAMVLLLMQSVQRGQILFAIAAGCFLGALIANQAFPTRLAAGAWIVPILVGLGFYVLAATCWVGTGPWAWMSVPPYARALPIDWATAGVGGAMAGCLVSLRMHESRYLEHQEAQAQGA